MQTTMKSAKRVLSMLLIFVLVVGTAFTGIGSFMHIADEAYAVSNPTTANVTIVGSDTINGINPVTVYSLDLDAFDLTPFLSDATGYTYSAGAGVKMAHALVEAVYYSIYGTDPTASELNVATDSVTAQAIKEKLSIGWNAGWSCLAMGSVFGNSEYQMSAVNNTLCSVGIFDQSVANGDNVIFYRSLYPQNLDYSYFDVFSCSGGVESSEYGSYPYINIKLRHNYASWSGNGIIAGSDIELLDAMYSYNYRPTDINGIADFQVYGSGTVGRQSLVLKATHAGYDPAYVRISFNFTGTEVEDIQVSENRYIPEDTSLSTFTVDGTNVGSYSANGLPYSAVTTNPYVTLNAVVNNDAAEVSGQAIYVNGAKVATEFPNTTGGSVQLPLSNGENTVNFTVTNGLDRTVYPLTIVKSATAADNATAVNAVINGIADYSGYSDLEYTYGWILAKLGTGKNISDAEKEAFLTNILYTANHGTFTQGDAAKIAIALSALHIDASRVPKENGTELNLVNTAFATPAALTSIYNLPYVLMLQDLKSESGSFIYECSNSNCNREKLIEAVFNKYSGTEGWGHENSLGLDSSAMMITALAPYYKAANTGINGISAASCAAIKDIVDDEVTAFGSSQSTNTGAMSSWGADNSNSTAIIISALTAIGVNPNTDTRFVKDGRSLIDGLLLFRTSDNRLGYSDTIYNYYGSLQGLEALGNYRDMLASGDGNDYAFKASVAPYTNWPADVNLLTGLIVTAPTKTTYNRGDALDLTGMVVKAVYNGNAATATELATGYTVSPANSTVLNTVGVNEVTVTYNGVSQSFNVIVNANADTPYVANKVNVKVQSTSGVIAQASDLVIADGTTVLDILKTVLNNAGKTCVLEKGGTYVASIDGLGEMDKGPNSGWMYNVNNVTPQVPASDYELNNGDTVLWYYTLDYTKDSRNTGMKPSEDTANEKTATTNVETTATVTDGKATASVSASDVAKAIEKVNEQVKTDTTGKTTEKEVVLEVKSTGNVDAVETTIPANTVNELAKADANVVVKTECGDIEIPADSMDNIATQVAGQELSITMENKKASEVVAAVGADKIKEETGLEGKALENVSIVEVTIKAGEKTVTSFGGKKISLSLPAENGQVAGKNYKVLAISADGTMELMTGVCVVDNGKKVVKVTSTHLTTFVVTGEEVNNPFKDVSANDYFFNPVLWAVEKNVTSGKSADTFAPFDGCTRAQMVTFLWRAAGSPWASANAHFSDVADNAYYKDAVEWAIAAGITKGVSETKFNPDGSVTREQLAAFIYRYAQDKGQGFTGAWMFLLDYDDASQVSEWADEAMHWCVMNNIVTGTTARTLSPAGEANRAQIVTMLYRYFNL